MAHFAKVNDDNIVVQVIAISNEQEYRGVEFITEDMGQPGRWFQCSFNTHEGKHLKGGTPLRKHYPSTGDSYDPEYDAFIPMKSRYGFLFNKETWKWEAPTPKPEGDFTWSDSKLEWIPTDDWSFDEDRITIDRPVF